jgi:hypothetical protein
LRARKFLAKLGRIVPRDREATPAVIVREGGRSSIPETSAIEPKSCGALDSRMRGNDGRVWRRAIQVIASEAKQSILSLCGAMDCFAALVMTAVVDAHHPYENPSPPALIDPHDHDREGVLR